jgi:bifunctional ADP-heptose synthase (sugar kinase/adenylyltransferase)
VVGDTIVDSYTNCVMIGGQTKTRPCPFCSSRKRTMQRSGDRREALPRRRSECFFCTVLGDDAYAEFVLNDLQRAGVDVSVVTERGRPTVNKNAIVVGGYRLLKVDTLDNNSITDAICNKMTDTVRNSGADAVIYADFRHGIFNRRTIPDFIEAIPAKAYRVADSQVASRWGNITEFRGFDLITPNEREARLRWRSGPGIRPLASAIFDEAQCKLLILKLGQRGCSSAKHRSRIAG